MIAKRIQGSFTALELLSWHMPAALVTSRKPWAWLLRHVYAADLSTCERCGGRMRWKELATTPDAIARLLARHGLSSGPDPPARRRPRPPVPEQLELAFGS